MKARADIYPATFLPPLHSFPDVCGASRPFVFVGKLVIKVGQMRKNKSDGVSSINSASGPTVYPGFEGKTSQISTQQVWRTKTTNHWLKKIEQLWQREREGERGGKGPLPTLSAQLHTLTHTDTHALAQPRGSVARCCS